MRGFINPFARRPGLDASDLPVGEPSRSRCNRAARLPGARRQKASFIVARGPSQVSTRAGERGFHASVRAIPTLAGDRRPRYGKKRHFTVGRGPVPRHRSRYGKNVACSLTSVGPECLSPARLRRTLRAFRSLIVFARAARFLLRT